MSKKVQQPEVQQEMVIGVIDIMAASKRNTKCTHAEWVERTNAGRDDSRAAYFGTIAKSWEVVSPYRVSIPEGSRYIDPSGNHGRHGWKVRYIGETPLTRSAGYLERLIKRHKVSADEAQNMATVQPGTVALIGEMSIDWAVERGIIGKAVKLSKASGPKA